MPSPTSTSTQAARTYGKVGGFAHLATLVKQLRATRPGALLLDGGDTWQGSATALWTKGAGHDRRLQAARRGRHDRALGVHLRRASACKEIVEKDFTGKIDFVAQNVKTTDFGDPVFKPYVIREINGVPVAIIGQAFPYTPIANPRYFVPDWTFGIQEENLQKVVDEARGKGAQVVVLLSHNGMDVDLKLASRVHRPRRDPGRPHARRRAAADRWSRTAAARRWSPTPGSNGKFLGVLDLDVKAGKVADFRYRLLPVFGDAAAGRPGDGRADPRQSARRTRRSSTRSSPSPRDCSTAAATSTARSTS